MLGVEWNTEQDSLRLAVGDFPSDRTLTKRALASNIARVYDILGWYSPSVIKVKVLLQQLWTLNIDWDDVVPAAIQHIWENGRESFPHLMNIIFPDVISLPMSISDPSSYTGLATRPKSLMEAWYT